MNGGEVNTAIALMLNGSHVRLPLLVNPWRVPDDGHGVAIKLLTISSSSIQKGRFFRIRWLGTI